MIQQGLFGIKAISSIFCRSVDDLTDNRKNPFQNLKLNCNKKESFCFSWVWKNGN
jgi:hypothetical protein